MNNIFSLNRTIKLIRKDMLSEYKNLIIWVSSSAGVMIVISALSVLIEKLQGSAVSGAEEFHMVFYILLLFPGGFILTSSMFRDVHDKSRNIYWLTLPGSTFEKLVSRLLISSLFYVILLTLLYPVLAFVSELFNVAVIGIRHDYFNPFTKEIMRLIPYYLVTQSIFFAGAATFRKHPFAKTLLSLAVFQISLSIITVLFLRIFFGKYFNTVQNMNFNESDFLKFSGYSMASVTGFARFAIMSGKIFFWGILAPFFYVLSYFKLSEKEVRDGF